MEVMSFEGVEKVREWVKKGQTLAQMCHQLSERVKLLEGQLQGSGGESAPAYPQAGESGGTVGDGLARSVKAARNPKPSLLERLAKRSDGHPANF